MKNNRQKKWVMDEWQHTRENGISLDVGGVSYSDKKPEELWKVLQRGTYMLDYEADSLGRIVALHIDEIKSSKKPMDKGMRCTNQRSG